MCYIVTHDRGRFNLDLLDDEDPFEFDERNLPHLFKHLLTDDTGRSIAVGPPDIVDAFLYGDPSFYDAADDGDADWLMLGQVPGLVIEVPLAPSNSGNYSQCRPIGLYAPNRADRLRYLRGE